ncbi:MAG TPA: aminodeoxychorismate/anthranilate synthase component II [Candidatus Eisenbacteria bacterium]|jgi:anthranilate synthase/aminodeoxychorismate synthase-like glutamine amidotransferase|nr:aminodeoxychorismate/anthranilate synthase component II [Candidatus Eisenbacteria bacterium]
MILMIDNYDSFTYNLVQYLGEMGEELKVVRNDELTVEAIRKLKPSRIVISPGPGNPGDAGVSKDVILRLGPKTPVLGVCLGHQCIGEVFGGRVSGAKRLMHGKTSLIYHDGKGIFKGIDNPFVATRYHSLLVEHKGLPKELSVTAQTKEKEIMGLQHKSFPIFGVQFHPESILTQAGKDILRNFLRLTR